MSSPTPLLSALQAPVVEHWAAKLFGAGFIYWAAGCCLLVATRGWESSTTAFVALSQERQLLLLGLFVVLVSSSTAIVEALTLPVLKYLEGYGPRWLQPFSTWRVEVQSKRRERHSCRLQKLWKSLDAGESLSRRDDARRLESEMVLHEIPAEPKKRMPSRLGNRLRSMELRTQRYGFDAVLVWPRLWLLLPETARVEVSAARARLDRAVQAWLWCVCFLPLGLLVRTHLLLGLLAIAVAIGGMLLSYWWALVQAGQYSELVGAVFDLYRRSLYEALGWRPPTSPADEVRLGKELSGFLERGLDGRTPRFKWV